ncbi:MAG: PaaI family thioesterase [Patescibacteria group bacterium]
MDENFPAKRKTELCDMFKREPLGRLFRMKLTYLDGMSAVVRMPMRIEACAAANFVQGGIIAAIADYACVYLAMMQCEEFTPLSSLSMEYLRPAVFAKDKEVIAYAKFVHAGKTRIVVEVNVRDENNILKAIGRCVFAKPLKPSC